MIRNYLRLLFVLFVVFLIASCGGQGAATTESSPSAGNTTLAGGGTTYVEPSTGWYWNPAEGGRGFAIERQGNQLFMAGFYYETTGEATWSVSTFTAQADGQYTGQLMRYSGGQTLLGTYKAPSSSKIADATLAFTTSSTGTLTVVPMGGGSPVSISLQAFPISTPTAFTPSSGAFQNGWWWNPAEGGRGYFVEMQGTQAFIGSFMYADSGQPTWYVSSATLEGPATVSGPLDQYSGGQSLLGGYKLATKSSISPGTMSFRLTSANTGTLILPNSATVNIVRFSFNPSTTPQGLQPLKISEVSPAYYSNDVSWFEVYNPNSAAVSLGSYSLRSSTINTSTSTWTTASTTFALPAVDVPAKGYLVVAAKAGSNVNLLNNSQIVYIANGNTIPFWGDSGSVELVLNNQTADFVRFGTSSASPLTAGQWSGGNVAALPSGPDEHGKSIVRLASGGMIDTNTAGDWTLVNFATPAGQNDVPAGVVDSDGDGIPDSAKVPGGTYGGLDLYAMGARKGRRDLFIQVDYMGGSDVALTPRKESLQKLTDVFAAKGIAVHLDAGSLYSSSFDPASFNLGGGKAVAYAKCLQLKSSGTPAAGCTNFYDYKSTYFDLRRKFVFHYMVFGNSQNTDGSCGSSGLGEVEGNDFFVTLGSCGFSTSSTTAINVLVNGQAASLMHELGHNLGLLHGGFEDNNYKPNYYSVMNYLYSFPGLSASPNGPNAANRYYYKYGMKGVTRCSLDYSPCSTNFIMDYSNGSSADLDENNLQESLNIGRGSTGGAYADWNNDGVLSSTPYARNLHGADTSYGLSVLKDYNDWGNLVFPFSRGYSGANSGPSPQGTTAPTRTVPIRHRFNPMNERPRHVIVEDEMPQPMRQFLHDLHHAE